MLEMPSGPFLPSLFNRIYVPICKEMILQKIITISFRELSKNSESTERLTHTLFQEWVPQVQLSVMVTFSLRVLSIFTSINWVTAAGLRCSAFSSLLAIANQVLTQSGRSPRKLGSNPQSLAPQHTSATTLHFLFFPLIQLLI